MKRMLSIALVCCIAMTAVSLPVFATVEDFGRDFYTDFEDFGELVSSNSKYYKIKNLETETDETSLFHFNNNSGTGSIAKDTYTGTHGAAAKITVPQNAAATQINFYSKNAQKSAVYGLSLYVPENANALALNSEGYNDSTSKGDWNYGFKNLISISDQKMTVLKSNKDLLTDALQAGWYDIRFGFDFEAQGNKKDQRVYFYITLPDGTQKITNAGMAGMTGNIIADITRFQLGITSSTTADGTYGLDDMSVAYMKDMVVSHDVTDVEGVKAVTISFNQDIYLPSGVDESSFITFYRGDEAMTDVTITPVKRAGFIRGAKITFANPLEAKYNYSYTVTQGITDLLGRRFGYEFTNTFTLNTGEKFTSVTDMTASCQDGTITINADVYHASNRKTVKVITALYKGNVLVKAQINDAELAYSKGNTVKVSAAMTGLPSDIGSDTSYNVRCFIWNDLESLTPIDGGFARWDNIGSAS